MRDSLLLAMRKQQTAEPLPPTRGDDGMDLWSQLKEAVRARVQPEQFATWFERAKLARIDDEVVVIAVQNKFARDWLVNYYIDVLEQAVLEVVGERRKVDVSIDPELVAAARPASALPDTAPPAPAPSASPAKQSGGVLWNSDIVLNPKYTFDNFVVGPCNRFGHAAAMGAGESPGKSYNPFFLHGSVGLGKTHLLQALCFAVLDRFPDYRILYLSCETFVNHFINALENGDLDSFRNKYRNVDVLVVDDIHLLANKERTQEEFFHTFNTLYNAGNQIVLSSDSPPKDIPTLQERLVSRFKWGMVTEIEQPCYETRVAIVKRKSRDRGCELPDEVCQMVAERIETNIRELEGAVIKLIGYSNMTGQSVTPDLTREVLRDVFLPRPGQPTLDDIGKAVTDTFSVKLSDMQSKRRTNSVAYPRQIAMYLAREITRHSLEEIGGYFGGRDHSTVLYAVSKISKLLGQDDACRAQVGDLLDRLNGRGLNGA